MRKQFPREHSRSDFHIKYEQNKSVYTGKGK